jgi:choline-sulfatase
MKQPNILFIMTDQMRADALGCAGGWARTPNLDRLAAGGTRFQDCTTTSPVCIPARVSLATGLYAHNTGVWQNMPYTLSPESDTWMQRVRDAGYATSVFGKTHLHPHRGDLRDREHLLHGYGLDTVDEIGGPRASARIGSHMTDLWEREGYLSAYREDYRERFAVKPHVVRPSVLPFELYADVYVGRRSAEYLERYDEDRPWFCWVSFGGPHEPWDTPEPYASMYDPADMPAPAPRPETGSPRRPAGVLDEKLGLYPAGAVTAEDIRAMRANYAGNVSLIDEQIGEILAVVESRGEMENTVIVFTSDHGELNGDHGAIYKECFLDGCLRVPMIVSTPESRGAGLGRVSETPIEWIDAGATILDLIGASQPEGRFARSLCCEVESPFAPVREEALSELFGEVCIVTKEWKMAVNRDGEPYLLFHRPSDPQEQDNLAGSEAHAEIRGELTRRMTRRIVSSLTDRAEGRGVPGG